MAEGYDGEVRVKVTVEDKEFNASMKDVGTSGKEALKSLGQESGTLGNTFKSRFGAVASQVLGKLGTVGAAAFRAIGIAIKMVMVVLGVMVLTVVLIVFLFVVLATAIIGLGVAAASFGIRMVNSMAAAMSKTDAYGRQVHALKNSFDNVKQAIFTAFAPLVQLVLPWVQRVTDWLIKMINMIAMLIAFALGQKTVMQYTAGSASDAAGSAGDYADEVERANEAAEGALGAFDQLNVLQQEQEAPESPDAGGGGGGQLGTWNETAVDPQIWEKAKAAAAAAWTWIKNQIMLALATIWFWMYDNFFGRIRAGWTELWKGIGRVIDVFIGWFLDVGSRFIAFVVDLATRAWDALVMGLGIIVALGIGLFNWLVMVWTGFSAFWADMWARAKATVALIWQTIVAWIIIKIAEIKQKIEEFKENAAAIWDAIKTKALQIWEDVKTGAATAWDAVKAKFEEIWNKFVEKWGQFKTWWSTNITGPLKEKFNTALDDIKTKWETVFTGIKLFVKNIINGIIGFLNKMLAGIASGINGIIRMLNSLSLKIPDNPLFGEYAGLTFGFNLKEVSAIQIPTLASGAVIPPNSEFLAVLGDQKSGTNIEAPADLIRQIVAEEMQSFARDQSVTINFAGSMSGLVQALKPYIDSENSRVGRSMIRGIT